MRKRHDNKELGGSKEIRFISIKSEYNAIMQFLMDYEKLYFDRIIEIIM